jgi:hypothetical protein
VVSDQDTDDAHFINQGFIHSLVYHLAVLEVLIVILLVLHEFQGHFEAHEKVPVADRDLIRCFSLA